MLKHIIPLKTSCFASLLNNAVETFSHVYLKKHNVNMANFFTNGDYYFELARQNVNNPFWRDVFKCAKYFFGNHCYSNPENDEVMILSQPIWNNSLILIDNKPVFYHHWVQGGIAFINDLLDEEGKFYTYDYFINTFNIKTNFLEFYGVLISIKKQWIQCLRNLNYRLSNPMNSFMNIILKSNQLCCKAIYDKLLNSSAICNKSYTKWSRTHDVSKDSWSMYCSIPFQCSSDVQIRWFQYRLLHRIIPTNKYLYLINAIDSDKCSFCGNDIETIDHLFCNCNYTSALWNYMQNILVNSGINVDLKNNTVALFGGDFSRELNLLIILIKYYVFRCKQMKILPSTTGLSHYLRNYFMLYSYILKKDLKVGIWERYWLPWFNLLDLNL